MSDSMVQPNFYLAPQAQPAAPGAAQIADTNNGYLNRQAQQPNGIQLASQVQQLRGQQIANQTAQQTLGAKQAIGQIMQNATGPDGQIDWNKAMVGVAASPQASFLAPEFVGNMIANNKVTADTAKTTLENAQTHYTNLAQHLLPLASDPNATMDEVQNVVGEAVADGTTDSNTAVNFLKEAAGYTKPGQLQAFLQHYGQGAQTASQTLEQNLPKIAIINNGATQTPTAVPSPGAVAPNANGPVGPAVTQELAPGIATEQLPNGAKINISQQQAPGTTAEQSPADMHMLGAGQDQLNSDAAGATGNLSTIQHMQTLLGTFQPGASVPLRAAAAHLAQVMGADPATVNAVNGGNYAAFQEFKKLQLTQVLSQFKASGVGSHLTGGEFDKLSAAILNPDTSPAALNGMLNWMAKSTSLPIAKQQAFNDWKSKGKPPSAFPNAWNQVEQKAGVYSMPSWATGTGDDSNNPMAGQGGGPEIAP
jgi:hypothetical protein